MKFDVFDKKMRVFETAHDHCALPGMYMVARLDGRNFTRLTRELHHFEAPFDTGFRDLMKETTHQLMNAGFRIIYGYTQSDEISLLFHPEEETFGRKLRKFNSILAGVASAHFSLGLKSAAVFDCRISQLPGIAWVVDYFTWRQEDASRNALNAHCYWMLRHQNHGSAEATQQLKGLSTAQKHELLFSKNINFNDLPKWQKRGLGLYWVDREKRGVNPKTGEEVATIRRAVHVDLELPIKEDYQRFICELLS